MHAGYSPYIYSMNHRLTGLLLVLTTALIQSCSPSHQIGRFAEKELAEQPGLTSAQLGISIYDPVKEKTLYDRQGDKYFIPASNTKLFSLYAGLKYLGDSLTGMRYWENDTALFVQPSGDPSFLHHDYAAQPVIDLLRKTKKHIYLTDANWDEDPLGVGWSWNDYNDDYMPERSPFPVYGNLIHWVQDSASESFYSQPDINWSVKFSTDSSKDFSVRRDPHQNVFTIAGGGAHSKTIDVPFMTDVNESAAALLKDTVGATVYTRPAAPGEGVRYAGLKGGILPDRIARWRVVHSRPVDSLFKPMMHRSDNFFAEQTLLMVSNEKLGLMSDEAIIDTLLKTDLKDLPQKPYWVDGSGLSRNDLFTPRDFIWLLDKLRKEYGLDRLKVILPTGGTGTLSKYYKQDSGFIFAKTGSLSGVVALSGYLITRKNHLLLFSILLNNNSDPVVRRKIEKFVQMIREKY